VRYVLIGAVVFYEKQQHTRAAILLVLIRQHLSFPNSRAMMGSNLRVGALFDVTGRWVAITGAGMNLMLGNSGWEKSTELRCEFTDNHQPVVSDV
jgi:hypothetical protein